VLASGSCVQLELPAGSSGVPGHIRHAVADVAPSETVYVPALQLMHADADVAPTETEYVPAPQKTQVFEMVAPVIFEYVPGQQLEHPCAPMEGEYLPASQLTQTVAPVSFKYLPLSQATHAVTPVTSEYLPLSQYRHPAPFRHDPRGQLDQHSVLSAPEYVPAPQSTQVLELLAPVSFEYLPLSQFTHQRFPSANDCRYSPATQSDA
jgi:hypothetical protein